MYFKGDPLFPFGYGLSYTKFEYSNINVTRIKDNYVVNFDLRNAGARDGEAYDRRLLRRYPSDGRGGALAVYPLNSTESRHQAVRTL